MGLSKEQVERHISGVKQRLSTEKEHNLHGFEFAKLCFKVKMYEDAIRYLSGYLTEKERDYRAQKWMGRAYEAIGNISKAIVHYKRSMELKEQKELVIAVAQLHCQLDDAPLSDLKDSLVKVQCLTVDHPVVLQLNEKIRLLQGSSPFEVMPNQMQTFLSSDIDMHIHFVKRYFVSGKLSQAFEYCQLVRSKGYFSDSLLWQSCVLDTAEKYHLQLKLSCCTDAEKILEVLVALLEAICFLFHLTADINKKCLLKCSTYLIKYDKVLFAALNNLKSIPSIVHAHYQVSVRDLCGQLYYMAACYLFLAGNSTSNVSSVNTPYFQLGELCLLASLQATPPTLEGSWTQGFASRNFIERWHKSACARLSTVGRLLRIIASSKGILYLKELPVYIDSKGGKLLLIKTLFGDNPASTGGRLEMEYSLQESFLANDNLADLSFELPLLEDLALCDKEFVSRNGPGVRGLLWLCLSYKALDMDPPVSEWLKEIFVGIKVDAQDLTRSDPDTLCLCDIEAFLVLLVHQHQATIMKPSALQNATIATQPLNAAMCAFLPCCVRMNSESLDWWSNVNKMLDSNLSAHEGILVKKAVRTNLGIIRGCRPLQLRIEQLATLARHFKTKAEKIVKSAESQSVNYRSLVSMLLKWSSHYWTIICNIPVEVYQQKWSSSVAHGSADTSSDESLSILSEARMTLANAALYENNLSTALQLYSMVKTPQAAWNQSQIYLLKAEHGDMETLESVNIRSANLKKALEMTTLALARLSPTDNLKIRDKLFAQQEELKQLLAESESSPVACSLDYGVSPIVPHHSSTPSRDNSIPFLTENDQCTPYNVGATSLSESLRESLKEKEEQLLSMKTYLQQLQAEMEEIKEKQLSFASSPVQAKLPQSRASYQSPRQVYGGDSLEENPLLQSHVSPLYSVTSESMGTTTYSIPIQSTPSTFVGYFSTSGSLAKPVVSSTSSRAPVSGYFSEDQYIFTPPLSLAFSASETPPFQPSYAADKPFLFVPQVSVPLSFNTSADLSTTTHRTDTVPTTTGLLFDSQANSKLGTPSFSLGGPLSACVTSRSSPTLAITTTSSLASFTGIGISTGNIFPNFPTLAIASMSISPLPKLPPSLPGVSTNQSTDTLKTNSFQPSLTFGLASPKTFPSASASASVSGMPQKFSLLSSLLSNTSAQSTSAENPFSYQTSDIQLKTSDLSDTTLAPTTTMFSLPSTRMFTVGRDRDSALKNTLFDPSTAIEEHHLDTSGDLEITPIVSLPLVEDIKSGEEDETVLFSCRAKLYRYDNSQWKERGVGDMKILKHRDSSKVRLVMRREQVLKLCCNHYITPDMSLTPFSGGTSAWAWYTPHDFADGISKPETLAIKFKQPETAKRFQQIIEQCIAYNTSENECSSKERSVPVSTDTISSGPKTLIKSSMPVQKNWTCNECYVENDGCRDKCAACEANKPSESSERPTTTNLSTPIQNTICHSQGSNIGSSTIQPLLAKPEIGASGGLNIEGLNFLQKYAPTLSSKQDCGEQRHGLRIEGFDMSQLSMTDSKEERVLHPAEQNERPIIEQSQMTTTESPAIKPTSAAVPLFTLKDSPFSFPSSSTFPSFPVFGTSVHNPFSSTSSPNISIESAKHSTEAQQKGPAVLKLTTTFAPRTTKETYSFSHTQQQSESLAMTTTSYISSDSTQCQQSENLSASLEIEPDVYFKPLVVLEEAELMTGEEDEEALFSHRAKLYRFNGNVGQWKEKGVGSMKILKHKQSNKVRVLMRREQVLKICCNHYLLPHMTLTPLANSDRAWVWYTSGEFSDETCKAEQLAVKFKERDTAQNFKEVFDACVHFLTSDMPANSSVPAVHSLDQTQDTDDNDDSCDVEITQIEVPTREKMDLARRFMLPETFYNYENKDPCPGCRGCLGEDQSDTHQPSDGSEPSVETHQQATKHEHSSGPSTEHSTDGSVKPPFCVTTSSKASLSFADIAASSSTIPFQFVSSKGFQGAGDTLFKSSIENIQDSNAEADVHFEPLITLPEVQVSTGEENETSLFSHRAKLFRFTGTVWKERGVGDIKILNNKCTNKARVLMRREQVLKVCCNHTITAEMTLVPNQGNDKSWTWYTPCDFADEVSNPEKFAVRFRHSDSAKKFKEVFDSCVFKSTKTSSEHQGSVFHTNESLAERFVSPSGSWCCDLCYVVNPAMKETCSACDARKPSKVIDAEQTQNVTPTLESSPVKKSEGSYTLSVSSPLPTAVYGSPFSTSSIHTEPEVPSVSPHTGVFQLLKTAVHMSGKGKEFTQDEVDSILANEQEVFSCIAELSYQDCEVKDWVTKGCGTMKILKNVSTGNQRVLMTQNDPKLSVLCSHPITSLMRLRNVTGQDFSWVWNGYEGDATPGETHFLKYCIKFDDLAPAEKFKQNFKTSQSLLNVNRMSQRNQSLSESESEDTEYPLLHVTLPPAAATSFTENRDDSEDEVIFLYEELPDPELVEKAAKFMLPTSFYLYEKKTPCSGCRGCTTESDGGGMVSTPSSSTQIEESNTSSDTAKSFTDASNSSNTQVPESTSEHFLSTNMLSFSDIVSSTDSTSVPFGKASGFQFQGAGAQLFPSLATKQEDAENPAVEADIMFEPIISLPEVISFKSWDDEADTLFVHRAKLFRYDSSTSQWKERGVGDLKILRHKITKRVRLIMRREQILKICCNHYITEGMELLPGTSDKSWIWFTPSDFSDDEPKAEKLAVRFKHVETAQEFQKVFVKWGTQSQQVTPFTIPDQPAPFDPAMLMQPDKSWVCSVCYVTNEPECRNCCACQNPNDNIMEKTDMAEHHQESTDSTAMHFSTPMTASNEKEQPHVDDGQH